MASLRVGIVAGESSGDILGSALMQALRQQVPDVQFSGVGGALMTAAGLQSRVPMERLAVMGLVEPLKRLPELLRIRRDIIGHFIANPPDVFIGIDSPDFNLGVELRLRAAGIRTVHYVSPSVWAWRRRRIRKIAAATDLVLTLFPFEADFYHQHGVPVAFVGHPLADEIPLHPDMLAARQRLGLPAAVRVLALLPGSRQGEVARLAPAFLETARLLTASDPELHCVLPCATPERRTQVEALLPVGLPRLHLLDGQSRTAMAAADAVLLASGTATLEALLLKKPMLVCYRMAALSYVLISRMLKVPYFSLPNLLAGRMLVEELVQDQVAAPVLVPKLRALLAPGANTTAITAHYRDIHQQLRGDASARAAHAVLGLL